MSGTISQSSYNRLLPLFKSKDELDRNLARDKIEVIPDPVEFTPVSDEAAADMLDDGDYGVSDLSVNAGSGGPEEEETDLTVNTSNQPQGLSALSGIAAQQKKSISDLYDKITQDIQQRYRAPDISDLLMHIGMGMMQPPGENDEGGFRGSLMRGLRGIGSYAQSRQAYKSDINKMLSNIDVQKAKSLADLQERYLTAVGAAMKPRTPTSMISVGPDAVARNKFTGNEILTPPLDAVEKLQAALLDPTKTPQDKLQTMRNFDKNFGYGAAKAYATDIYAGE